MNNNEFILMFERSLSKYTGAPYVVLTDSCTNAIFLCLKYLNIEHPVGIPSCTYISTPQQIIHAGKKVKWIHEEWEGSYNLINTPIWDSAVGFHKNMYKEKMLMCLSFQQKKALPIGKGGAILLENKEDYEILKRMAWDGRDSSISVKDDLENIILGYHMNMTPDDAAKGILLLNQYSATNKVQGTWLDYPNLEKVECLMH
jgi:dTDP-4-amino-4,6-dideoxygalactose transaminase